MEKLYSPGDVLRTETDYDEMSDTLIVKRSQDVEPLLDLNKAEYDPDNKRFNRDLHKVASIPLIVVERWLNEGINVFDPAHMPLVRKKLNDPEYRFLRTKPGRL